MTKNGLDRAVDTAEIRRLQEEIDRLEWQLEDATSRLHDLTRIGYRAICCGDEYDFGTYADYLFEDYGGNPHAAHQAAEQCIENSDNGGRIEDIFPDTPKPRRIH